MESNYDSKFKTFWIYSFFLDYSIFLGYLCRFVYSFLFQDYEGISSLIVIAPILISLSHLFLSIRYKSRDFYDIPFITTILSFSLIIFPTWALSWDTEINIFRIHSIGSIFLLVFQLIFVIYLRFLKKANTEKEKKQIKNTEVKFRDWEEIEDVKRQYKPIFTGFWKITYIIDGFVILGFLFVFIYYSQENRGYLDDLALMAILTGIVHLFLSIRFKFTNIYNIPFITTILSLGVYFLPIWALVRYAENKIHITYTWSVAFLLCVHLVFVIFLRILIKLKKIHLRTQVDELKASFDN